MNWWRSVFLAMMLGVGVLIFGQPAVAEVLEKRAEEGILTAMVTTQPSEKRRAIERASIPTPADKGRSPIAQAELAEITNVSVEETEDGFTLRLESSRDLTVGETSVTGNAAIADISNAVLNLPEDEDFFVSNPAEGIALLSVSALPNNRVRIAITGADAPPTANFQVVASGLAATIVAGEATAQTSDEDAIQLTVTGEQADDDYFVPDASTATRTDTPLRDIPNSIQVIPRQVIEDQQATSLTEVLENSAGVAVINDNNFGEGSSFNLRGFNNPAVLRDGFIVPSRRPLLSNPEVANLEQVEVLRGPASVLYGQSDPGGVINIVSKQPLAEPFYNFQFQAGNRGFVNPSIDLSGPLTDEGNVRYRLNSLYRREESFRDFNTDFERFFVAPTLAWDIGDRTDLTVSVEYINDNQPYDFGLPPFNDGIPDVPFERVANDPDDFFSNEFLAASYNLEHRFSDNWKLRNQFLYTNTDLYSENVFAVFPDPAGDLFRAPAVVDNQTDSYSFNTNVQGRFNTGSIEHQLLFGVDLLRAGADEASRFGDPVGGNIFDPDSLDIEFPDIETIPENDSLDSTVDQLGIYVQDQIDLLDNLILVAGLRYDTSSTEVLQFNNVTNQVSNETNQSNEAFTPRIGFVYQPIEPISLYANYARSFAPNLFSTDVDGNPLPPEEGEGFEFGIRGEIVENRLSATLAYFDITKQNVATADPNSPPGVFASIATGEQRSRGVDFNLTGEISPGWNIVASYAYVDGEVTEDNTLPVGNRLPGVPDHSASLWTTYEIQAGDLQGLGFGLGFNYVGEREANFDNSFQADSYFIMNAAAFYRRDDWCIQLNVDNLFDTDYIESALPIQAQSLYPGAPTTVRASVSYTF